MLVNTKLILPAIRFFLMERNTRFEIFPQQLYFLKQQYL